MLWSYHYDTSDKNNSFPQNYPLFYIIVLSITYKDQLSLLIILDRFCLLPLIRHQVIKFCGSMFIIWILSVI